MLPLACTRRGRPRPWLVCWLPLFSCLFSKHLPRLSCFSHQGTHQRLCSAVADGRTSSSCSICMQVYVLLRVIPSSPWPRNRHRTCPAHLPRIDCCFPCRDC
ncbi:hypothetical protein BS50DRAFT_356594 [Corynespora cassiicola Philippines]|uniref:Secreted protein n=1 Tax=Corynespora cassiicola Philippines TaxID=1448308 RepID=A0A2T2NRP7_CORCC|nr:hypothetical protein BS50DRAFT_356594 [Corynespora cassiicola Philippines]